MEVLKKLLRTENEKTLQLESNININGKNTADNPDE